MAGATYAWACPQKQRKLRTEASVRTIPDRWRGKQDVVFQMDVLVKVLLKFFQAVIERVIRRTRANGRDEVAAQALDCRKKRSGGLMLAGHHGNGICHSAEARIGKRAAGDHCGFQCSNIRKQDVLLLGKMVS